MSETLSLLSDLLGSRKSVDETTPDRPVLNEIDPKLNPAKPTTNETDNPSLRTEIRDDILIEDLAPPPIAPVDVPPRPRDRHFNQAIALLEHYSFEIEGRTARDLVGDWAEDLPSEWLRLAVLEALYQGRYKAVSVAQILAIWERKQQPKIHFNGEFERLICDRVWVEAEAQAAALAEVAARPAALGEGAEVAIEPVPPVRLPDLSSSVPSGEPPIASQSTPDGAEDVGEGGEGDEAGDLPGAELPLQRSHPTQIAQFIPEGNSHVYDKLRDLARSSQIEAEEPPVG